MGSVLARLGQTTEQWNGGVMCLATRCDEQQGAPLFQLAHGQATAIGFVLHSK